MRFLITGGAGFIGAALANALVRDGHYVRVLDDLSAGDPGQLLPEVSFTRGDVRDVPKLWTLLQGVQGVFHLAARVSIRASVDRFYDDAQTNVMGTLTLLQACAERRVRTMLMREGLPSLAMPARTVLKVSVPVR